MVAAAHGRPWAVRGAVFGRRRDERGGFIARALTLVGLVVLLIVGAWRAVNVEPEPDPHFVAADKAVTAHELVTDASLRDYLAEPYVTALRELALVDPDSLSAVEARRLELHVLAGQDAQREAAAAAAAERAAAEQRLRERREATVAARAAAETYESAEERAERLQSLTE